ncbi:MAG: hypothetical protein QM776_17655 [Rhodocyclaceae bacterium]
MIVLQLRDVGLDRLHRRIGYLEGVLVERRRSLHQALMHANGFEGDLIDQDGVRQRAFTHLADL